MEEIWKDVSGYEGLYKISNIGNVFSCYSNKILSPGITNDGYKYVVLFKNKQRKNYTVHRLVAIAFIDNPNNLPCVNHKDENTLNNCVDNLEWCTIQYNNTYKDIHMRRYAPTAKHVYRYDRKGTIVEEYDSANQAGRSLHASVGDIVDCCNNNAFTYLNSVWSYKVLSENEVLEKFNQSNNTIRSRKNNKLSKPVKQFDLNMNFINMYPSTQEASRQLGISQSLIASVCRGEHPHTHNFIFKYI